MSDKKDRGRRALDVASSLVSVAGTVVDVGGTGGGLAGGKLLWTAVTTGVAHRQRRQAEAYLKRLAKALGNENTAALAVQLDAAGENEIWETVEEGFRAMMGAINESAKKCIALLVADYVLRQELPDREFQLLGALLAASDDEILRCLLAITNQVTEIDKQILSPTFQSNKLGDCDLLAGRTSEGGFTHIYVRQYYETLADTLQSLESDGGLCPDIIKTTVRLLERYEFGELSTEKAPHVHRHRSEKHPIPASHLFRINSTLLYRLRRLHNYLAPAFFKLSSKT